MRNLKWLQVSDLHLGDNSSYSKRCRAALIKYMTEKKGTIDYVFITGDIIFAKGKGPAERKKAYNEAIEYVEKIYDTLWDDDEQRNKISKRLFIIPGNHDLKRDKARIDCISGLLKNYNESESGFIDKSYLDNTKLAMADYMTFYRKILRSDVANKAVKSFHYVIETDKLNILHINTCLASCNDGDDGKLIIGFELLNTAIEKIKNKKPTIAIAHHNFDCLNKNEQKRLEVLLKSKNISLFLCGHAHERESNLVSRINQVKRLNTFTCGTLMPIDGDAKRNDSVLYYGEMNIENFEGLVYAFSWDLENEWHDDKRFGLAQDINDNYRLFSSKQDVYNISFLNEINNGNGIISKIVSQQSYDRNSAFLQLNNKATKSLSIYGIGITSVSKNTELFDKILSAGGTIKLCMVDPSVFKNGDCTSLVDDVLVDKSRDCNLKNTNFCIYSNHINDYIRKEYYEDVVKSYNRIIDYKKTLKETKDFFQIKVIKSFIPLSINIVNENMPDSELIIEYNMPFTSNRLLIELSNSKHDKYYGHIKNTFSKIWEMAEEVQIDVGR